MEAKKTCEKFTINCLVSIVGGQFCLIAPTLSYTFLAQGLFLGRHPIIARTNSEVTER